MRSVSNNRWDGRCTDQSLFLQHAAVGLWGKWASVFLWRSEQLSRRLILSGMIISRRWPSGRAWQVCSEEQCGKLLPARRFRFSGDTGNSCVIFPVLSHWFSFPFILPFSLASFSAARSKRWRPAPLCSRCVTLLHYFSQPKTILTEFQHHPSLNILACD